MAEVVWLARVGAIRQWQRDGRRAPHKPLLLLYLLGRLQQTGSSRVAFADARPVLDAALAEFVPNGSKSTSAYPFVHLETDGVWSVQSSTGAVFTDSPASLLKAEAVGVLDPAFEHALLHEPGLAALVAHVLLDGDFPSTIHAQVCAAVGLDVEDLELDAARSRVVELRAARRSRDRAFRADVLLAYEYQCAVCGFEGRVDGELVGLDAAHVRWWAFDGPDEVSNGLCLCALHHQLLDRGVIGLTPEQTLLVSRRFVGRTAAARALVIQLAGKELIGPQPGLERPADTHISWHAAQVIRGPARLAG